MERWELLVQNRDNVNIAQIITWNDYGESHYVGRIAGALPMSQSWTIGFDHQGTSITSHSFRVHLPDKGIVARLAGAASILHYGLQDWILPSR